MTLQELINAVMLKATGKATELAPSNAKWKKIRGIANEYQNVWMHENHCKWNSRYERNHNIGTISNNDSYAIDDEVAALSSSNGNNVYVEKDGKRTDFQLVDYDDLRNYPIGNYCAVQGDNLVFNARFAEDDPCYGGKIFAPVYLDIEDLENADDDIVVDNPRWLVLMCAAEYIRNDVVKQNQYGNLVKEANNLMEKMLKENRPGQTRKMRGNWRNPGGRSW